MKRDSMLIARLNRAVLRTKTGANLEGIAAEIKANGLGLDDGTIKALIRRLEVECESRLVLIRTLTGLLSERSTR